MNVDFFTAANTAARLGAIRTKNAVNGIREPGTNMNFNSRINSMAVIKIIEDREFLKKKSRPVDKITAKTLQLLDDMRETLRSRDGCGLAAPQVGVLRRVILIAPALPEREDENDVDVENESDSEEPETDYIEMINPVVTETSGEQQELEGCLSFPGQWGITKRPMRVKVRALDRTGTEFEFEGEALVAREICHEIDHLDGALFFDSCVRMVNRDELEM